MTAESLLLLTPIIDEYENSFVFNYEDGRKEELDREAADKLFLEAGRLIFNQNNSLN